MYHIAVISTLVIGSVKWGKWARWKEYLPTIYYFCSCNLLYHYFSDMDKHLWMFKKHISKQFITELLYLILAYPCLILLFLGNYPLRSRSRWVHYFKYISISIILEFIGTKLGAITYMNGWTFGWTAFFYLTMYPMIRLHYKNPILALILSVFFTTFYLIVFNYELK